MSVCLLKPAEFPHHQHVIFVSLESLLTLLEWQLAPYPNQGMVDGGAVNFFSKSALNHVLLNAHFEKVHVHTLHYVLASWRTSYVLDNILTNVISVNVFNIFDIKILFKCISQLNFHTPELIKP